MFDYRSTVKLRIFYGIQNDKLDLAFDKLISVLKTMHHSLLIQYFPQNSKYTLSDLIYVSSGTSYLFVNVL